MRGPIFRWTLRVSRTQPLAEPRRLQAIAAAMLLMVAACAGSAPPVTCQPAAAEPGVVWVVDHGWHTEIGLRVDEITGPLGVYRRLFPGARVLMFGFGKRTWMTAKVESLSELIMGPVPGPGAVQVTALAAQPGDAYDQPVTALRLPPGGMEHLSDFIWSTIGRTATGEPRLISEGLFPGSVFYASAPSYSLAFNCNAWTARALSAASVPISAEGVVFAGSVLRQTARAPGACLMHAPPNAPGDR